MTLTPKMTYFCYIWAPFASPARVKLDTSNLHLHNTNKLTLKLTITLNDPTDTILYAPFR